MTDNPIVVTIATIAIIAASAFFVAVEFALLAARRHRFEDSAPTSRAARAALRSSGELTVLLAGSQLGITVCVLALGAITKPAVHHALTPLFEVVGLPYWAADATGFVLALVAVTFLHLVIGEMMPKSWAIAHPERSAIMLAIPMRGFMFLTRPLLRALNEAANWCLIKVGVEPVDEMAAGQSSADLRQLVEHSANVGALSAAYFSQLSGALDLEDLKLRDLLRAGRPTAVPPSATVGDVQDRSRTSSHLRILVAEGETVTGVVHVRDTLTEASDAGIGHLVRQPLVLPAETTVYAALTQMRENSFHLVVVTDASSTGERRVAGVVTMSDVLRKLFPDPQAGGAERTFQPA